MVSLPTMIAAAVFPSGDRAIAGETPYAPHVPNPNSLPPFTRAMTPMQLVQLSLSNMAVWPSSESIRVLGRVHPEVFPAQGFLGFDCCELTNVIWYGRCAI